jgi:thiol-disulfide isomerase/thioredoxin
MLARAVLAVGVFAVVGAAYLFWKRAPRGMPRLDLTELGIQGPAVVQFTTRYCAPCKAARPHLEEVAGAAGVHYEQVDVGERPEVARRYGVRTVPTIVVTAATGDVLGTWTRVPVNGELAAAAMRAKALR